MKFGKLSVAVALAAGAASAADPPAPKEVVVQATILKVRDDALRTLCPGEPPAEGKSLACDPADFQDALKKCQAAGGKVEVQTPPRLTLFDGQKGVVCILGEDEAPAKAGSEAKLPPGKMGIEFRCTPRFAPDGQATLLRVEFTETRPGAPVLVNNVLQPTVNHHAIHAAVRVPLGKSVLLGVGSQECETRKEFGPPVLSQVPYLNRLFKNVGIGKETEHTLLWLTPTAPPAGVNSCEAALAPMTSAGVTPACRTVVPNFEPRPMPVKALPQVLVEAVVFRVPTKACADLKLDASAAGSTSVTVDPAEFRKTLAALKAAGQVDVLSRPLMLLTENQRGHFQVGSRYPVTPAGPEKPSYATIGIDMHCTPRLSPSGLSTFLRVEFSESEPGTPIMVNNTLQPVVDTQSVESMVRIPTGQSVLMNVGSFRRKGRDGEEVREETVLWLTPKLDGKAEDYAAEMSWSTKDLAVLPPKPATAGGVPPVCRMVVPNFPVAPMLAPPLASLPACCFPYGVVPAGPPSFVVVKVPAVPVTVPAPVLLCGGTVAPAAAPAKHEAILKILVAEYRAACKAGDTAKARTLAAHCLELDPTCFGK